MDSDNELNNTVNTHDTQGEPVYSKDANEGKNIIDKLFSWKILAALAVASVGFLLFLVSERVNPSSAEITLFIEGPEEFRAQEKVEFEVGFANNSEWDLTQGSLYIMPPEFLEFGNSEEAEAKFDFSNIKSGEKFSRSITFVSKESNTEGNIEARIEYTPSNFSLGKTFSKESVFDFKVNSLPVTVIFSMPDKAVSGQKIASSFNFVADENFEPGDVYIKLEMPEGFMLEDSEPPIEDGEIWKFENVNAGDSYRADFEGTIRGGEGEVKNFKLMFGKIGETGDFAAQHETLAAATISSSPLTFKQYVNGKERGYLGSPGEELRFLISYENKSGADIEGISITAQLIGDIFDFVKLNGGTGYFNKGTRTIVWNENFMPALAEVKDGGKGEVEFSVSLGDAILPQNLEDKNKSANVIFVIEPDKAPLSLKGLSLRAEGQIEIKLNSVLSIISKAHYYDSTITNSGPIPPRVGEKTTYTIVWRVENTTNSTKEAEVVAVLPEGVEFENKVYPSGAVLEYDSNTRTVTWDLGNIAAGTGSIFSEEKVYFQVSILPNEGLKGKVVKILGSAKVIGKDEFTGEFLEAFSEALDTSLPDDTRVGQGDGIVE